VRSRPAPPPARSRPAPPPARPAPAGGFTLLELLAAITLFSLIVVGFVSARNNAIDQAGRANDARILRYLAGHQMGRLRLGVNEKGDPYEVGEDGGDFADLGDAFAQYTWHVLIEEVIAAGRDADDEIPSLFEEDEADLTDEEKAKEGEPIKVLRVTLTVTPPEATEEEALTLVTFRPPPQEKAAAAPAAGGGG
jgi:prepilin-type N-terminal cleavage/methylation domain-containing protein